LDIRLVCYKLIENLCIDIDYLRSHCIFGRKLISDVTFCEENIVYLLTIVYHNYKHICACKIYFCTIIIDDTAQSVTL